MCSAVLPLLDNQTLYRTLIGRVWSTVSSTSDVVCALLKSPEMKNTHRRGMLIVISSPSGAGKTTLVKRLNQWDPSIKISVSATTRPPRQGETDGKEYCFVDRQKFQCMVQSNAFLEHAEVFGHLYGTPNEPIGKAISSGRDFVFDIDWQGGMQIRKSNFAPDTISIFVLPPSISELEQRLRARGKDNDTTVMSRMSEACSEISHWLEYDYVLVNKDMERVLTKVKTIIKAERLRRTRRLGLAGFVKELDQEFERRTK